MKTKVNLRQTKLKLLLLVVLGLQMSFPWIKEELQSLDLASTKTMEVEICGVAHTVDVQLIGQDQIKYTASPNANMESICNDCSNTRGLLNQTFKSTSVRVPTAGETAIDPDMVQNINAILQEAQRQDIEDVLRRQIQINAGNTYDGDCAKMAAGNDEEEDGVDVAADDEEDGDTLTRSERAKIRACTHVKKGSSDVRPASEQERATCRLTQLAKLQNGEMDGNDFDPPIETAERFTEVVAGLSGDVEDIIEEWLESDSTSKQRRARDLAKRLRRTVRATLSPNVANRVLADVEGAERLDSGQREELTEARDNMVAKIESYEARGEYREAITEINGDIERYNKESDSLFERYGEYNEVAQNLAQRAIAASQTPSPLDDLQVQREISMLKHRYPRYYRSLRSFMTDYKDVWDGRGDIMRRLERVGDNEFADLRSFLNRDFISAAIMDDYRSSYDTAMNGVDLIGMLTEEYRNREYLGSGISISNLLSARTGNGLLALGGADLVTALPSPTFSALSTPLDTRLSQLTQSAGSPFRVRGSATSIVTDRVTTPGLGVNRRGIPQLGNTLL